MVATPYTKYMVSIMDVDMAAAVVVVSHERAETLGVPVDRRVYLRGWQYAADPIYVAEHPDLSRSPAMSTVVADTFGPAAIGVDDVAHFDLYSCFGSSVNFMRDALGIRGDDPRALTVTGGLPYHGGAGSNYMTHSIAEMVRTLRSDPGSFGLVTGVGMHMTKHVAGLYSTRPPLTQASALHPAAAPKPETVRLVDDHTGSATVAASTVVFDREGPAWGLVVVDLPEGRTYGRIEDPDLLADAATSEWTGRTVKLDPHPERPRVNRVVA